MTAGIGIGTVQFGLDYGISNPAGRPKESEVAAILQRAREVCVDCFDTAPAYGDAETLLGKYLHGSSARIVTKVPAVSEPHIEPRHGARLIESLQRSLERLRTDRVYAVLLHRPEDLDKPGWEHLVAALHEMKARGWAERIGVSIYGESQWELATARYSPEIVQLPLNALDQRPVRSGLLSRMKSAGVEIHTRSAFLQGLLLMASAELPEYFAPIRANIAALHARWSESGLSALAGCLAAVLHQDEVDAVIVGVNSLVEFEAILEAWTEAGQAGGDCAGADDLAPCFLDPNQWPKAAA